MRTSTQETETIGEVIAANTTQFTAQCRNGAREDGSVELPDPPPFGAFVVVGRPAAGAEGTATPLPDDFDPFEAPATPGLPSPPPLQEQAVVALYGVVFHAEIGALEAGRPLTAFGLDEETLRREQPQIYELLATRFSAALVGYEDASGTLHPFLPPRPPRPHARVWLPDDAMICRLTDRLDYLRPLLLGAAAATYPADDLAAALLRNAWRARGGDEAFLLRAGRELAALLPTDYDRLRAIVNRIVG
jgi:hypothetical protein